MIGRRGFLARIAGALAAAGVKVPITTEPAAAELSVVTELPLAPELRSFGPIMASGFHVPGYFDNHLKRYPPIPLNDHDSAYAIGRMLPDGTFRKFPNTFHRYHCPRRPAYVWKYRNDPIKACMCDSYRRRPIP